MKYLIPIATLALLTNEGSSQEIVEPELEFEIDLDYYES